MVDGGDAAVRVAFTWAPDCARVKACASLPATATVPENVSVTMTVVGDVDAVELGDAPPHAPAKAAAARARITGRMVSLTTNSSWHTRPDHASGRSRTEGESWRAD
jgi:hypothetical protein